MMLYYTNHTWAASDYIWESALSISTTSVRGITLCLPYHCALKVTGALLLLGHPLEHWNGGPFCHAHDILSPKLYHHGGWGWKRSQGCMDTSAMSVVVRHAVLLLQVGREVVTLAPLSLQPSYLWPQLPCVPSFLLQPGSQSHVCHLLYCYFVPWTLGYSCWDWRAIITGSPLCCFLNSISVCSRPLTPI